MKFLRSTVFFVLCAFIASGASWAAAEVPPQPSRTIVIGDAHGDYDQYMAVLLEAELINARGRWMGGSAQLVQLGDVTDRGPDSRKIIDLLRALERSAPKKGGAVHFVLGNHEAMNMKGDLRYVHPGEYAAFATSKSKYNRDKYFDKVKTYLEETLPEEEIPTFDDAFRESWNVEHPLGWYEHRKAYKPEGKYGSWILEHDGVLKLGSSLYMHGGIGPKFATTSLEDLNRMIHEDLEAGEEAPMGITNDADGPLWYRGLAQGTEETEAAHVEALLAFYGVERIMIGHTPLAEAIIPRFGGKVIVTDVGLSAHYGSAHAYVEIVDGIIYAVQRGQKMVLPMQDGDALKDYLLKAQSLEDNPERLNAYIESTLP